MRMSRNVCTIFQAKSLEMFTIIVSADIHKRSVHQSARSLFNSTEREGLKRETVEVKINYS